MYRVGGSMVMGRLEYGIRQVVAYHRFGGKFSREFLTKP